MSSVGLNFGSPTSGAGFDVATTVAAVAANLQAAETPYHNQLTTLQSQDTAISSLGTLMSALSTSIQNLTSATGALSSMEGSSSDQNVLQLSSASIGAVAGSHNIVIQQLAQTSSLYGSAVNNGDVLSGSISIQIGTASPMVISVDPSNASLRALAASINGAGAGVTASVISGTHGEQLSLTSTASGAAGGISLTGTSLSDTTTGNAVSFTTAEQGQDALMTVDGIAATSSSNTVSSVIPGVTFQLLAPSSTPVHVEITNNTTTIAQSISTLITSYNAVVNALSTQEGKTSAGAAQPLYGNPLIATLQGQLDTAITKSDASAPTGMYALGISLNNDGTLALNSDTMNTALNSNFNGVVSILQGSGGMGQALSAAASNLGSSQPDGALALVAKENASIEKNLNSTIATIASTISTQTAELTASLNAANETLQLIPTQLNLVNELYSAISGYGKISG